MQFESERLGPLVKHFGDKPLLRFKAEDVSGYQKARLDAGISGRTERLLAYGVAEARPRSRPARRQGGRTASARSRQRSPRRHLSLETHRRPNPRSALP